MSFLYYYIRQKLCLLQVKYKFFTIYINKILDEFILILQLILIIAIYLPI